MTPHFQQNLVQSPPWIATFQAQRNIANQGMKAAENALGSGFGLERCPTTISKGSTPVTNGVVVEPCVSSDLRVRRPCLMLFDDCYSLDIGCCTIVPHGDPLSWWFLKESFSMFSQNARVRGAPLGQFDRGSTQLDSTHRRSPTSNLVGTLFSHLPTQYPRTSHAHSNQFQLASRSSARCASDSRSSSCKLSNSARMPSRTLASGMLVRADCQIRSPYFWRTSRC